ncbi:MAG TPA: hypothetical protein VEC01_11865 [Noviherbaspirillum sp.]|uniref:hypothetical protein n=1 Tax=Noviherbaspirillum sp. TaxID=1926288 RepID=UPI002D4579D3|nr:hypothetical protein [Noviherbaspirillum sp.]HYD96015.1 hypothetical protein [Noviherbaspirillum sp.]
MFTDHVSGQARFALQESFGVNAEWMNRECACISLEASALRRALEHELGDPGLYDLVARHCPHVFAALPVFVSGEQAGRMADVVAAVEAVVALPAYREAVLAGASPIARHDPGGTKGVFAGYDFHVGPDGVSLIEINTNAGGAMLNTALARAQHACCPAAEKLLPLPRPGTDMDRRIMAMFRREWSASRGQSAWRTVAIVDDAPAAQYLYPEFLMFQRLFECHGLHAVITPPSGLVFRDGVLWHGDTVIDLVYNRLTDFMLDAPSSAALRAAYLADAVVLTPHPRAHALYADKRNLALLSDPARLQEIGVPDDVRQLLQDTIPRTEIVSDANAQRLWNARRALFFKPRAGFGGRGAYRGDKLTRRAWQDILAGDYVAQSAAPPGERLITPGRLPLKYDVRNYAYDGEVQALAARLYQGQTTNFRTEGGGFAPVYRWP